MVFRDNLLFFCMSWGETCIFQSIYFTFNDFLVLVQQNDVTQLRGGQCSVSTPPFRDRASIRALLSQRIELWTQKNICLNYNENFGMSLNWISFWKAGRCPIVPELTLSKVTNENFTFALKKNFHMRCKAFVELITQCSGNGEGSTISPVFLNKIRQICLQSHVPRCWIRLVVYIFPPAILPWGIHGSPNLLKYMQLKLAKIQK